MRVVFVNKLPESSQELPWNVQPLRVRLRPLAQGAELRQHGLTRSMWLVELDARPTIAGAHVSQ